MEASRESTALSIFGHGEKDDGRLQNLSSSSKNPATRGFLSCFFSVSTVKRAVRVALVVGPILGFINHFDLFLGAECTLMRAVKIAVTFLVPFFVSAYSSATTMMAENS